MLSELERLPPRGDLPTSLMGPHGPVHVPLWRGVLPHHARVLVPRMGGNLSTKFALASASRGRSPCSSRGNARAEVSPPGGADALLTAGSPEEMLVRGRVFNASSSYSREATGRPSLHWLLLSSLALLEVVGGGQLCFDFVLG